MGKRTGYDIHTPNSSKSENMVNEHLAHWTGDIWDIHAQELEEIGIFGPELVIGL